MMGQKLYVPDLPEALPTTSPKQARIASNSDDNSEKSKNITTKYIDGDDIFEASSPTSVNKRARNTYDKNKKHAEKVEISLITDDEDSDSGDIVNLQESKDRHKKEDSAIYID